MQVPFQARFHSLAQKTLTISCKQATCLQVKVWGQKIFFFQAFRTVGAIGKHLPKLLGEKASEAKRWSSIEKVVDWCGHAADLLIEEWLWWQWWCQCPMIMTNGRWCGVMMMMMMMMMVGIDDDEADDYGLWWQYWWRWCFDAGMCCWMLDENFMQLDAAGCCWCCCWWGWYFFALLSLQSPCPPRPPRVKRNGYPPKKGLCFVHVITFSLPFKGFLFCCGFFEKARFWCHFFPPDNLRKILQGEIGHGDVVGKIHDFFPSNLSWLP